MRPPKRLLEILRPKATVSGVHHPASASTSGAGDSVLRVDDAYRRSIAERWLILSDFHVPFHDETIVGKVGALIEDFGGTLTGLVLNGDFLDLYSLGRYNYDSVRKLKDLDLSLEYQEGRRVLANLLRGATPNLKKVFLYGNHEDRYWRELERGDHGKYGDELRDPAEALGLYERGFEVKSNWRQDYFKIGAHLEVTHGLYTPVHVAKKHLDEFQGSVLIGHSHRVQMYVEGKRGAWNLGFLGDIDSPGFHYQARTQRLKWCNSFAIVYVFDNGDFQVLPVLVHDKVFIVNGKAY